MSPILQRKEATAMTTYTIVEDNNPRIRPDRPNRWLVISEHTGEAVTTARNFKSAVELIVFWLDMHNELHPDTNN